MNGGYVDQKRDVEIRVELKDVEEAKIEENDDDDDDDLARTTRTTR